MQGTLSLEGEPCGSTSHVTEASTSQGQPPDAGTTDVERQERRRAAGVALAGVAGVALFLAAESLGASLILDVSERYPGLDKVGHVVQYGVVFLVVRRLAGGVVGRRAPRLVLAAAIALLLGLGDEFFQRLFAARTFDLADLAANSLGVALGMGLGPVIASRPPDRGVAGLRRP